MLIDDLNRKAGCWGRRLEAVVVDPASELAVVRREGARAARRGGGRRRVRLLDLGLAQIRAARVRGAERPPVLPGAVRGRGESKNVFYTGAAPNQQAIPAVEYLMSEGRRRRALRAAGHRLRLPAHDQQDSARLPQRQGHRPSGHHGDLHAVRAFGLADHRRRRQGVRAEGKQTAVVSTINGDANVPFYKELANQEIDAAKSADGGVLGRRGGAPGIDTSNLVGHLAAWNYFMSVGYAREPGVHRQVARLHQGRRPRHQRSDGGALHRLQHVGAGGAPGRHHRDRRRPPGDVRPEPCRTSPAASR